MCAATTCLWTCILHLTVLNVVSSAACEGYRTNSLSDNYYDRKLFKFLWVLHKCGSGLVWDQPLCQCIRPQISQQGDRRISRKCPDRPPILTTSADRSPATVFQTATTSGQEHRVRTTSGLRSTTDSTERFPFPLQHNNGIPCSKYRSNAENKLKFYQKDAGGRWQPQRCAPRTRWSQKLCTCVFIQPGDNFGPALINSTYCEVLLLLPFNKDIRDKSPNNAYIGQSNRIKIFEEGAFLDGTSSLNVPFFKGNFLGNVFHIQFSFKSASEGMVETPNKIMTLVSNGCKDDPPSLHLTYTTGRNFLILETVTDLKTEKSPACSILIDADGWSHVSLKFCPTSYAIFVNGQMCSQSQLKGSITITNCDLVFGDNFYESHLTRYSHPFVGFIDNVNITRGCGCRRDQPMISTTNVEP